MPNSEFLDFVLDQLDELGRVAPRRMFGGVVLYCDDVFFAIVYRNRLYFKTDATTQPAYEARGMGPFRPNQRQTLRTYYEVPVDVLEDQDELVAWAREAIAVQRD